MLELIPLPSGELLARTDDLNARILQFVQAAKADSTRRAYRVDWSNFETWCAAAAVAALPATPETVAAYIADQAADHAVATIQRRLTAISQLHKAARLDSPTSSIVVREVLKGIRRTLGTAQLGKAPTLTDDVAAMIATTPKSLLGSRDRALLLLGFAGAFRRSELVALDVADLTIARVGMTVLIRKSKTDQEGRGQSVGIPYASDKALCPIRAVEAWYKASGIDAGAVFRGVDRHGNLLERRLAPAAVALVVKRYAAAAGLDADRYAGHSLRSGLATSAAAAGVEERIIMRQTRHTSERTVRRYIKDADLFRDNAAGAVLGKKRR